jgi:hypothetical protein
MVVGQIKWQRRGSEFSYVATQRRRGQLPILSYWMAKQDMKQTPINSRLAMA